MNIPTVKINHSKSDTGYCIINEADFDAKEHKLFELVHADDSENIDFDSGDAFSDDQLREAIKEVTGKAPHHKMGHDKLVARFDELNEQAVQ
jgi:hypothetical protein